MPTALLQALDVLDRTSSATSGAMVGSAMLDALAPLGATSLWARSFKLTPGWTDPKVNGAYKTNDYSRIRRDDWWGSSARVCADDHCPLALGSARFLRPFLATEIAAHDNRHYGPYWEALGEFGVGDTIVLPSFKPDGSAEAFSIWVKDSGGIAPHELTAIKLAMMMALDRMRDLTPAAPAPPPTPLTPRERDCLFFVAEGKSDWEVSVILGIAQATAHAHIENAKRKLNARTRAQAVARLLVSYVH